MQLYLNFFLKFNKYNNKKYLNLLTHKLNKEMEVELEVDENMVMKMNLDKQ